MEAKEFFLSINAYDIPINCIKYVEPFVRGIISDKGRMQLSRDSKKKTFTILSNMETDRFFTELFRGFLKDLEQEGEILEKLFSELSKLYERTEFSSLKEDKSMFSEFILSFFDLFLFEKPEGYTNWLTNLSYLTKLLFDIGGRMFYSNGKFDVFGSRYCTLTVELIEK